MNARHAALTERHRKNVRFEQEHAASLDYEVQRAGGIKPPPKKTKPKPADGTNKSQEH